MATAELDDPDRSTPEDAAPAPSIQHPKGAAEAGVSWDSHRVAAASIRFGAVVVPALLATAVTWQLGSHLPRPDGAAVVVWFVGLLLVGAAVYVAFERAARRVLPLAALLQLSLVMPDHTASRYRIALRSGTTRHLRQVVADAEAGHFGDTPAEAAERVLVLVAALNRHDRLTRGHSERVRAYTEVIGQEMGLSESDLSMLRWAALLHDVGKVAVPGEILNKRGRLTDEEFDVVKTHPVAGAEMVVPLRGWLGDAVDAVGQHHERWDGCGYPERLAGEDISLAGRIVAVADTFDVITSSRSYKKAMTLTAARQEIARCAGTQFDPRVTRALLTVSIGRLWVAGGALTWGTSLPVLAQIPAGGGLIPAVGNVVAGAVAAVAIVAGGAPAVAAQLGAREPTAAHAEAAADTGRAAPGAEEGRTGDREHKGSQEHSDEGRDRSAGGGADDSTSSTVVPPGATTAATGTAPPEGAVATPGAAPSEGAAATPGGESVPATAATAPATIGSGPTRTGSVQGIPGVVNGTVGVINGVSGAATGVVNGASGAATGVVNGASGTATGVVNGAVGTATGVVNGVVGRLPVQGVPVLPTVTVPTVTVPPVTIPPVTVPPGVTGIINGLFGHR